MPMDRLLDFHLVVEGQAVGLIVTVGADNVIRSKEVWLKRV